MQRVTTDGESVIAPEVPELIKKQDHTPVQSSERGEGRSEGREGGEEGRSEGREEGRRGGRRAWMEIFHLSVTLRSDESPPLEKKKKKKHYKSFLCVRLDGTARSVLH